MNKSQARLALSQYNKIGIESGVEAADPHRIIQMLMEGVLDKTATAMGHMKRNEIEAKGNNIGLAITIIGGLAASLDHEEGGEISTNLSLLYDYMIRRLVTANLENDLSILQEVHGLMREIKEGWDGIAPTAPAPRPGTAKSPVPSLGLAPA